MGPIPRGCNSTANIITNMAPLPHFFLCSWRQIMPTQEIRRRVSVNDCPTGLEPPAGARKDISPLWVQFRVGAIPVEPVMIYGCRET